MAGFSIQRFVEARPEVVFRHASDFARAPEIIEGIKAVEMLTEGTVGVGTRFKETRIMCGREATEEMEVTAFDPPRSYTLGAESCGCRYVSTFRFEPRNGGTGMEMHFEATSLTFMAKVMGFVMRPLMKRMVLKEVSKDLDAVKAAAEAEGGTAAGGQGL